MFIDIEIQCPYCLAMQKKKVDTDFHSSLNRVVHECLECSKDFVLKYRFVAEYKTYGVEDISQF